MKPTITWILIANARDARVVTHDGAGKDLDEPTGLVWQAPEPVEFADRAGTGHSIAGHSVAAA